MGLYDEMLCQHPLPDGWVPPAGTWFQTKDTPDQFLSRYVLTDRGSLRQEGEEALIPFHGALTFYTTNISGIDGGVCCTRDDAPPWQAEYVALFDHGALLKLEGQRVRLTDRRQVSRAAFAQGRRAPSVEAPMPTDRTAWTPAMRALLVGRDPMTLGVARDDAQHWLTQDFCAWRLVRCGRAAAFHLLRITTDRAQVSCGECLALLVGEERE